MRIKALIWCTVEWKKTIKEMKTKKDDDVPGDVLSSAGRRWSQNNDTTDQQHT
jgi:hypothetical protein